MTPQPNRLTNGWTEWSKHVLKKLEELEKHDKDTQDAIDLFKNEINKILTEIKVEVAMLKVKSGIWGLIGGLIPVAIAIVYILLKGTIK